MARTWKHTCLMKGNVPRLLPLLHTLVEERVGEGVSHPLSRPFMSQPCPRLFYCKEMLTMVSFCALKAGTAQSGLVDN
jgi:hypothetical protein